MMADSNCKVLVVIPLFNHGQTVLQVVKDVLEHWPHVLVLDDGSDDGGADAVAENIAGLIQNGASLELLRHPHNQGKGAAILTAAGRAEELGFSHIVTIDADGQHDARDLPAFLAAVSETPRDIIVGRRDFNTANVPFSSRFGRSFSEFWMRVQTGCRVRDMQSGFRAYPVPILSGLKFSETRYAFEIEVLVKASWAGFTVREIDIRVHYPKPEQRVSHFRAFKDNLEISLLNTRLTMWAMMPIPHKQYQMDRQGPDETVRVSAIHPLRSLRTLLSGEATPRDLALSAFVGIFIATLPLIGLHSIGVILVCSYFKLNRIWGLAVSQLGMPPLVPALCIETGYYLQNDSFLTEISWQTLGHQAWQRLGDWVLGSLLLAPLFGLFLAALTYLGAWLVQRSLSKTTVEVPEHE